MSDLIVVFSPLISVASVYVAGAAYRTLYPYSVVKEALEVVARYRSLDRKAREERSRRLEKKLRSMRPEYGKARSLLFKALLIKFAILMLVYTITGITLVAIQPFVVTPYKLPLIIVEVEEGLVMPMLYVHFFMFMYSALLFREMFI